MLGIQSLKKVDNWNFYVGCFKFWVLAHAVDGHAPVFINDVRLSDFKKILLDADFRAEFVGGVLIVNGVVALRRSHQGLIEIEGMLNNDYYKVRDLLYSQYALV